MLDKRLWLFAILIWLLINLVFLVDGDDDSEYACAFTDVAEPCKGYENKHVKFDIGLSSDSEHATLSGTITLDSELGDTCEVYIDIWKKLDDGQEDPVFSMIGNICGSLLEEDAPWSPVFEDLGITRCPIVKGDYKANELKIKLDFADAVMSADFVAKYQVQTNIKCGLDDFACFGIGVEVYEKD